MQRADAPRSTPAQTRARDFLDALVVEGRSTGRYRLPTVRALARLAQVGPMAMLKTVQTLTAEGVLDARPKQGITIVGARSAAADPVTVLEHTSPDAHLEAWERVYQRLQSDLLSGIFEPGSPCPSFKELSERYGTSYQSLRQATDRLLASGALVRHKKGLRVPLFTRSKPGGSVVLFAHASSQGGVDITFARGAECLALFQAECCRRNLGLSVVPVNETESAAALSHRAARAAPDPDTILGYVLISTGLQSHTVQDWCAQLAPKGKPLAVFDDSSQVHIPEGRTGLLRVVRATGTQTASRRVGRFLLQLGHRAAAYLSPTHGARWSQERLAGLESAFAEAGVADGVTALTCDSIVHTLDALKDGKRIGDFTSEVAAVLRNARTESCSMAAHMLTRVQDRLSFLMEEELLGAIEQPLFEQACALPGVHAWVTSSDYVASRALRFLRARKIAVPQQVSLVGFDDSLEAFAYGITSYNFDMHSVASNLLGHILSPPAPSIRHGNRVCTDVEGFITERASTMAKRQQNP